MRLGEIKQQIDKTVNEQGQIELKNTALYGGQAYQVNNYGDTLTVLENISKQQWSDINAEDIAELLKKYPKNNNIRTLPQEEFSKLSSYVSTVNQRLPIYYSILEQMVPIQDEQVINIKLPTKVKSLDELSAFNKRLSTMFKSFQVDGQFEFCDFDKGTSWYEICVVGALSYKYFIASLNIAQEYFKAKTEYFKSKEAKISFEAAKAKQGGETNIEEYKKQWLDAYINEEIRSLVDERVKELNGETSESLQTKLISATTQLIKELGEGTEFHLSLNPPAYAKEQAGQLVIDYKKMEAIKPAESPKEIEAPKKEDAPTA